MYAVGAEYFIFGPLSVGASYQNFKMKDDDAGVFSPKRNYPPVTTPVRRS
ncbi:hypothetical protein OK016_16985 [Vibrio chagasii]|nr:hypothetical protein [Vibrio chagasii]